MHREKKIEIKWHTENKLADQNANAKFMNIQFPS